MTGRHGSGTHCCSHVHRQEPGCLLPTLGPAEACSPCVIAMRLPPLSWGPRPSFLDMGLPEMPQALGEAEEGRGTGFSWADVPGRCAGRPPSTEKVVKFHIQFIKGLSLKRDGHFTSSFTEVQLTRWTVGALESHPSQLCLMKPRGPEFTYWAFEHLTLLTVGNSFLIALNS